MSRDSFILLLLLLFTLLLLLDKKSASEDEQDDSLPLQIVNTGIGELPPGAEISDSDDYDLVDSSDPHRALNIDLDIPLRDDEKLPVLEHRVIENNITQKAEEKGNKKDKVNLSLYRQVSRCEFA